MKATLLKTESRVSKYGGTFYYAFFKGENGKSYRSCLFPKMGNFARWKSIVGKENVILDGLNIKGNLVDADSYPSIVGGQQ
jgi:hypothetical protein